MGWGDEEVVSGRSRVIACGVIDANETSRSGLVDFEMWQPYTGDASEDSAEQQRTEELQRWGLAHRPPAKNWWAEFGIKTC